MQPLVFSKKCVMAAALISAALCQVAGAQNEAETAAPPKAAESEIPRLPVRATPGDYRYHVAVGKYTLAAEFQGHTVPSPQLPLTTEDYVVMQVAFFGPDGSRLTLSRENFTLKINDKKAAPAEMFLSLYKSIKDPEYVTPGELADKKAKESKDSEQAGTVPSDRNPRWHPVPFPVQRSWERRLAKASLPEGDRPLPEGGLIYFRYGGRESSIYSMQLSYAGPAGKASIDIEP